MLFYQYKFYYIYSQNAPTFQVYLIPDAQKVTKRKTRVIHKNCHPSFMEMLEYRMPWEVVKNRTLQVKTIKYLTGVLNLGKGMFHPLKIIQDLSPLLHGDARVPNALGSRQEQDPAGINIKNT
jgi:hypothetical protein